LPPIYDGSKGDNVEKSLFSINSDLKSMIGIDSRVAFSEITSLKIDIINFFSISNFGIEL